RETKRGRDAAEKKEEGAFVAATTVEASSVGAVPRRHPFAIALSLLENRERTTGRGGRTKGPKSWLSNETEATPASCTSRRSTVLIPNAVLFILDGSLLGFSSSSWRTNFCKFNLWKSLRLGSWKLISMNMPRGANDFSIWYWSLRTLKALGSFNLCKRLLKYWDEFSKQLVKLGVDVEVVMMDGWCSWW
ncbi:hypothetical protein PIB30_043178, partial [Stylosanthes scabra]|nr:hypothetical protein [Stylosanthes scabra]